MNSSKERSLIQGNILKSLIIFAFPVLLALFLQAMYGAADLIIVGQFAGTCEQSGVASGSQLFHTITMIITGLSMGVTVFVGHHIGAGDGETAGRGVGAGIAIFTALAVVVTALVVPFSDELAAFMHAPAEAFGQTSEYVRICGIGTVFITAYNVIGAVFRGIGDSKTPLVTVTIACVINIVGDLILVAGFGMGAAGAAIATVSSQAVSVVCSLYLIKRKKLPFKFSIRYIRFDGVCVRKILLVGVPIALQEMLVQFSFLFIQVVVNGMGVMRISRRGRGGKGLRFPDAGRFRLYAGHFGFCGTEQRRRTVQPFPPGVVLRNRNGSDRRLHHGYRGIFCGRSAGRYLFRGRSGHRICSRLSESLRHRLSADRDSVLFYRPFQRLRQNDIRHVLGDLSARSACGFRLSI